MTVCIIEKGSEVGAHILSGAILDPVALNELIPDWKSLDLPVSTEAVELLSFDSDLALFPFLAWFGV